MPHLFSRKIILLPPPLRHAFDASQPLLLFAATLSVFRQAFIDAAALPDAADYAVPCALFRFATPLLPAFHTPC